MPKIFWTKKAWEREKKKLIQIGLEDALIVMGNVKFEDGMRIVPVEYMRAVIAYSNTDLDPRHFVYDAAKKGTNWPWPAENSKIG